MGHWKLQQMVYQFSLAFHGNYGDILYHFRDKLRYWSKIAIFSYLTCIRRQVMGSPSRYCDKTEKLDRCVYWTVKKFDNMFTHFDTIHERVRHPDRQTPHDGTGHAYA